MGEERTGPGAGTVGRSRQPQPSQALGLGVLWAFTLVADVPPGLGAETDLSDEDARTLVGCRVETRMKRLKLTQARETGGNCRQPGRKDLGEVREVTLHVF